MKKDIRLSIIIVNYNSEIFLLSSLKSIYSGTLPKNQFEVNLIDNHSNQNSVGTIKEFIEKEKLTNIKIYENEKNLGFAKANNIGVKRSCGEYVLFLNPDTKINEDTLSMMLEFMDKDEETAVATCFVLLPNGQIDDASHRGFPTPWNAFCHFTGLGTVFSKSLFFNGYHLGYRDLEKIHEIDACCGAFMLVRRRAGEEINWFDEDYFWYGEDLDFCYRIKKLGWKVKFIPSTKVTHIKGISSGIKNQTSAISTATKETKILATLARFEVMKTFYKKHYLAKYPVVLTYLIFAVIDIARSLNLLRFKK